MKTTDELKFLAMDIVTDILTESLDHNRIHARVNLPETQQAEVTEMVRALMLSMVATLDDRAMLKILERY